MSKVTAAPIALFGSLLLGLSAPAAMGQGSGGFKVIVNATNPVTGMTLMDASQLFLKRTTRWTAGGAVHPIDLPVSSAVREKFSRQVLGKPTLAVEAYWNKQIYSGQVIPPLTKASDREVVAFVRDNAGAIGYIATDTPLEGGVKVVTLTGGN
jgi:ABC-type phosphate transport system substrate-binding protein